MAADDRPVLPPRQDRLDEAELAQAPLEGIELVVADPTWIGGVGPQLVDGDLLDGQGRGLGGHRPPFSLTATLALPL
jgi:hypothetical protein